MPGSGVTPPSSVPASQASFFLRRRRPAPALPLRLSPVLTLPPTCQSAEEERERKPCACLRVLPSATRHATPPLRYPSRRGRGLEVVVDGTGLDWEDAQAQAWGGSARIHPFLPQADATRAAPEADANHPVHSSRVAALPWRGVGRRRGRASQGSGARSTFRVLAWTATDRWGVGGRPAAPPAGDRRTDDTSFLCRSLLTQRAAAQAATW
jgi:hypothetical protein